MASKDAVVRHLGTDTLLAVAEHRFVVTAAHVVREALQRNATMGVSGATNGHFVAAAGRWFTSGGANEHSSLDQVDVAVYEFNSAQIARFESKDFVRISDVSFVRDLSTGFFVVTGFPGMWSTTLTSADETMKAKMLQYATYALQGSTAGLDGYNPERHFLLEASPAMLIDHTGALTSFRTRTGHPAQMPQDLRGVSGCSVWMVGDLTKPIETWSKEDSRLVGIETSIYPKRSAIKATRWNAATTLLYNAVPELRPVLELYARQ
ncbi:MAG: hypothetical protein Q8L95_06985 [Burkholderiales bacterium]|nr:hypothetical protein [Burkholderiales bacterium]